MYEVRRVMGSDSKIALGYIRNDVRHFHVFVSNRVQQIRDLTTPKEWQYLSKVNPADYGSRGLILQELDKSEWWNVPAFCGNP